MRTGIAQSAFAIVLLAAVAAGLPAAAQSGARRRAVKQTSAVTADDAPCAVCEQPRFWIVSSRRCPQRAKGCCTCCRFDEFVYQNGRCRRADRADFARWMIPGAPTAVVVHGSFTKFSELLSESCALYRWLRRAAPRRPLNIVIYTWPSDDLPTGFFPIDILVLGRRSAFNGFYLAQFLQRMPRGSRVSLVGHSHGARTVSAFLHLHAGGIVQGCRLDHRQCGAWRLRTVLFAAAMDHDWLDPGERYGRALCGTEALLNMRNRRDLPLKFYPLRKPFGSRALARTGFTRKDRRRLGRCNAKICEIDVTDLVGRHHLWIHYFNRPEISAAIAPYVYFTDDDARVRPAPTPAKAPPASQIRRSRWQPTRDSSSRIRHVAARRR